MKEKILIEAPAVAVWQFIVDPILLASWNDRIVGIDRRADAPFRVGDRFAMTFRMSDRERAVQTEVMAVEPPRQLTLRHALDQPCEYFVTESYVLEPRDGATLVEHTVDLSHSGVPLAVRLLGDVLQKIGTPVGKPLLEALKREAEQAAHPRSSLDT